ncbi:hypothetical protein GQ55_5G461500 [Panicum hallii var. hallii]|uniref:Uncharacterized protein n=1 Tax=Panicum hallii var. hallii TaxID=1504633 RepID=A0A2T7DQI9_9POAL|nr:hypothetical protein GQ55_5G461500 [Panicum hallii var. hallii]
MPTSARPHRYAVVDRRVHGRAVPREPGGRVPAGAGRRRRAHPRRRPEVDARRGGRVQRAGHGIPRPRRRRRRHGCDAALPHPEVHLLSPCMSPWNLGFFKGRDVAPGARRRCAAGADLRRSCDRHGWHSASLRAQASFCRSVGIVRCCIMRNKLANFVIDRQAVIS